MSGEWSGYYRIRIGDLRVIYYLDEANQRLLIDHLGSRGDVYKKR